MAWRGAATAVVLVTLLLAPSALAWSQYHGSAERNMRVSIPGGPMDIVRVVDPSGKFTNTYWGSRALPTSSGIILLEDTDEGCDLLLVAPPYEGLTRRMPIAECNFGVLVGFDAAQEVALLCDNSAPEGKTLRAVHIADGTDAWSVVPARDLNAPVGSERWLCLSAALDVEAREFAVGFEAYPLTGTTGVDHVVAMGSLDDGTLRWRGNVPSQPGILPLDTGAAPETYPRPVYPRGVTLTTTGFVVTGFLGCGPGQTPVGIVACLEEGFVAWFTRDGDFRGMESGTKAAGTEPDPVNPVARTRGVSQYAMGSGPIAAVALGKEVVLVNPEAPTAVLRAPMSGVEPTTSGTLWYAGAWTENLLLVPILTSLTAFDPATLQPVWSFTEGLGSRLVDVLVTTGGETYVLVTDLEAHEHRLVVLKTADGQVIRRLPLPGLLPPEHEQGGWRAHVVPVEGQGLVVADLMGRLIFLGPSAPHRRPHVEATDLFPAPGEEITLAIDSGDAEAMLVNWGDGSEETLADPGHARHAYAQRGGHDIALTSLFADGTTATRVLAVDVGGTPPAQLTTLQKAFSPEYQNWTFFVLGTLITVIGLAVTVGRNRRRFSKLERELAAVEEIRMLSVQDPRNAILALKSYRDRLPEDLAKRRIDDSQYQILDLRSARLLKVLRTRQFAPFDARLSTRYHRLLDAAFEDAILQPSEEAALVAALDVEEALSAADRRSIAVILADFTSAPHGSSKRVFNNA